jgi:hypothetical protein
MDMTQPIGEFPRITLPDVSTTRGGITFDVLDESQRLARDYARKITERMVADMARLRNATMEIAVLHAIENDLDVHIYEPPTPFSIHRASETQVYRMRHIGVAYTPMRFAAPTVHVHPTPGDEFAWEMAWEDSDLEHWLF